MINIGLGELILVFLIALIVIKPGDLPKMAFYLGQGLTLCRRKWQEFLYTLHK